MADGLGRVGWQHILVFRVARRHAVRNTRAGAYNAPAVRAAVAVGCATIAQACGLHTALQRSVAGIA